jgi:DNA-binding response OmpR family regulator
MAVKILIVDDDLDTLRLVGLMLQRNGYEILAASNGLQALSLAESGSPDLILLDVMMPNMDGYEVARKLRSNPNTSDIPILMLTAKSQLDDKVAGFESGADDYLTKPTHPTELQMHIKALLGRSTRTRQTQSSDTTEKRGFTMGVLAARGGLGVTTTAVNLASALLLTTGTEVILAELRPGYGTLAADLGFEESLGLAELLKTDHSTITRQMIKDRLLHHQNGLNLLLASSQPSNASLVNAIDQFEVLVEKLGFLAPFVVLDLGSGLPELTQKLIKICHHLIVIVEPVPNSITHSRSLLDNLYEMGISKQNITPLIVNRIRSETQMNWTYVQERLDFQVPVMIMPSPEDIFQANRKLTTAVAHLPDSSMGQQFKKLAGIMVEHSTRSR